LQIIGRLLQKLVKLNSRYVAYNAPGRDPELVLRLHSLHQPPAGSPMLVLHFADGAAASRMTLPPRVLKQEENRGEIDLLRVLLRANAARARIEPATVTADDGTTLAGSFLQPLQPEPVRRRLFGLGAPGTVAVAPEKCRDCNEVHDGERATAHAREARQLVQRRRTAWVLLRRTGFYREDVSEPLDETIGQADF
jgi:hypothetical protein